MSTSPGNGLRAALAAGRFAVTAEIGPPRGADAGAVMAKAEMLRGWVDAANVTDNQGAHVRMGSLGASVLVQRAGVEPIMQVTCRDRNRMALQSDLLSAGALGVPNVLLLTGDHPRYGDHPDAMPVFDLDGVQLTWTARTLRDEGELLSGRELDGRPGWLIGSVTSGRTRRRRPRPGSRRTPRRRRPSSTSRPRSPRAASTTTCPPTRSPSSAAAPTACRPRTCRPGPPRRSRHRRTPSPASSRAWCASCCAWDPSCSSTPPPRTSRTSPRPSPSGAGCGRRIRLEERYVPLGGLDLYALAPGVSGEMLRPLLESGADLRMHVSNGALASFVDTLPLLHPYGKLVCHDLFVTETQA